MRLTEKDKQAIRLEKRIGFVFGIIVIMAGIIALFLISYYRDFSWPALSVMLASFLVAATAIFVAARMNRKYNRDLKEDKRVAKTGVVQLKEEAVDYEAGSGVLYIPILGDLFPKLWGQKMSKLQKYNLIIDNHRFTVAKELFDSIEEGDEVTMYYPACSDTLLGIER